MKNGKIAYEKSSNIYQTGRIIAPILQLAKWPDLQKYSQFGYRYAEKWNTSEWKKRRQWSNERNETDNRRQEDGRKR